MLVDYDKFTLYPKTNNNSFLFNTIMIMPYVKKNIDEFKDKFNIVKESPLYKKIRLNMKSDNDAIAFCLSFNFLMFNYF